MVFTALPLFMRALFERDFDVPKRWESKGANEIESKAKLRKRIPEIYSIGRENQLFTFRRFFSWFFNGIFHACIVVFIPLYASEEGILTEDGHTFDQ